MFNMFKVLILSLCETISFLKKPSKQNINRKFNVDSYRMLSSLSLNLNSNILSLLGALFTTLLTIDSALILWGFTHRDEIVLPFTFSIGLTIFLADIMYFLLVIISMLSIRINILNFSNAIVSNIEELYYIIESKITYTSISFIILIFFIFVSFLVILYSMFKV